MFDGCPIVCVARDLPLRSVGGWGKASQCGRENTHPDGALYTTESQTVLDSTEVAITLVACIFFTPKSLQSTSTMVTGIPFSSAMSMTIRVHLLVGEGKAMMWVAASSN